MSEAARARALLARQLASCTGGTQEEGAKLLYPQKNLWESYAKGHAELPANFYEFQAAREDEEVSKERCILGIVKSRLAALPTPNRRRVMTLAGGAVARVEAVCNKALCTWAANVRIDNERAVRALRMQYRQSIEMVPAAAYPMPHRVPGLRSVGDACVELCQEARLTQMREKERIRQHVMGQDAMTASRIKIRQEAERRQRKAQQRQAAAEARIAEQELQKECLLMQQTQLLARTRPQRRRSGCTFPQLVPSSSKPTLRRSRSHADRIAMPAVQAASGSNLRKASWRAGAIGIAQSLTAEHPARFVAHGALLDRELQLLRNFQIANGVQANENSALQIFEGQRRRREAQQQVGDGRAQAAHRVERAFLRRAQADAVQQLNLLLAQSDGLLSRVCSGQQQLSPTQNRKVCIERWCGKLAHMKAQTQAYQKELLKMRPAGCGS